MRETFGEAAVWYETRLPPVADPLVVFELGAIARALPAMIAARLAIGRLTIAPLLDAPRAALVERLAGPIFAQNPKVEARAAALGAFASGTLVVSGRPIAQIGPYDPLDLAQLREAMMLADTVLVPTRTAAATLESLAGWHARTVALLEPPAVVGPAAGGRRDAVVVWDRSGIAALRAWFAFALRNFAVPAIVAGPGEEAVLARARVVVITDAATPLEAWRLRACGAALVVERTSGAHEWLTGVFGYDRAKNVSIAHAVRAALGAPSPLSRLVGVPPAPPAQPRVAIEARAALIVRTKDRPELLERALASVERQTHDRTCAIVINDGGATVGSLVARFPRARLIERSQSDIRTAINDALAVAPDETFVAILDDDDAIAPDFVAVGIDALVRSGCDLAVCGAVHAYINAPDDLRIGGYAVFPAPALERSALLVGNLVPGAVRVIVRRAALERIGGMNVDLPLAADYEGWLRLSAISDVVRIPGINAAYTIFVNRANCLLAPGNGQRDALRTIYALHPVGSRARLLAAREAMLAAVERSGGYPVVGATRPLNPPLSLREKSFQG